MSSILNVVRLGIEELAQIKLPHEVEECVELAQGRYYASFNCALAQVVFGSCKFIAAFRMLRILEKSVAESVCSSSVLRVLRVVRLAEYRGNCASRIIMPMALNATIYNFNISLSDMDRSVYESFALRVAQHPTETPEYMLTRVLAYCLEFCDGIAFAKGLDDGNEPAVWARDPTGELTLWVEVGMPDAEKLHRASKAADRVAIYTHRDPEMLRRNLAGKTIHRVESIPLFAFERSFLAQLVAVLDRRMTLDVSVTEGHVYINAGNATLETQLHEQSIVG